MTTDDRTMTKTALPVVFLQYVFFLSTGESIQPAHSTCMDDDNERLRMMTETDDEFLFIFFYGMSLYVFYSFCSILFHLLMIVYI